MDDRRLIDLTIVCRGVPVGSAPLILRTEATDKQGFRLGPATHLPAYEELIGRALRAYKEAKAHWACMPYPEAAVAQAQMAETWNALSAVWATLELRDETGALLPVPVERFAERVVSARFNDLSPAVLMQLRERYGGARESEPPAA